MLEQEERRILGLLLDFEFLLAGIYGRALTGQVSSAEQRGEVKGGRPVEFANVVIHAFVKEAFRDASSHIATLQQFLSEVGERPYSASLINLESSFTKVARSAGILREKQCFDAFANEANLLLSVFMLEDVGMTVCAHALSRVDISWSRDLLTGLHGSIGSRSAIVRALLFAGGFHNETNAIAVFRQQTCGLFATAYQGNDHGVGTPATPSMMPVDLRGLSWPRTADQSAAILAGSREGERESFYPCGINAIRERLSERTYCIPLHYDQLASGTIEDGIKQIATFESERVGLEAIDLDTERFQIRENTVHQPWTQSEYMSWVPSCIEVSNAIVHGAVGIVGVGRHAIAETLWHTEPRRHRYRMVAGVAELDLGEPEILDGTTVSILVGAAESYWHAVIDAVARLVLVPDELWPKIDRVLYPSTSVRGLEMLDLFGLPAATLSREVRPYESFRVRNLIQPSSLHGLFDYHPTLLKKAFTRLKSNTILINQSCRKIFIDRRASPLRKLVNEDELIAALPDFVPVRLEDLTVAEQICLFHNADIVVAPHGAGLTNIGFSRSGTFLIELMMDSYCNWCYRRLAAINGIHYRCVLGSCLDLDLITNIHHVTWKIEKDDVLKEINHAQNNLRNR